MRLPALLLRLHSVRTSRGRRGSRGQSWARTAGDLAEAQDGVVSRDQLVAAGLSPDQVDRRIASGYLRPVHARVYAVGHAALGYSGRCHAALLAAGEGSAISFFTAAALHGWVPQGPGPVHVSRARHSRSQPGMRVHRCRSLEADDVVDLGRLRVTSPRRTIWDLATTRLSPRDLERTIDAALRSGSLTLAELQATLAGHPQRPGARRIRAVVESWTPGTERTRSGNEKRLLRIVARAGLPAPALNAPFELPGGETILIDALWRDQRVACEVDTLDFHGGPGAFHADRRRDAQLVLAGLTPLRLTDADLRRPAATASLLAGILDGRG